MKSKPLIRTIPSGYYDHTGKPIVHILPTLNLTKP